MPRPGDSARTPLPYRLAVGTLLLALAGLAALPGGVSARGLEPAAGLGPEQPPAPGAAAPAAPQAPVSEEYLLNAVVTYLQLSRQQLIRLIPIARQIDRQRAVLLAEHESKLRRALDRHPDPQSEEAAALRKALEEVRERVAAEVVSHAAPLLARLLTREQIALAWRLGQGNPPEYARADLALLVPAAGFVGQASVGVKSLGLRGTRLQVLPPGALAPAEGEGLAAPPTRVGIPEENNRLILERLYTSTLELQDLGSDSGFARLQLRRPAGPWGARPFAQWVAETNDLAGLAAAIEPLVRRVVMSPQWVVVLTAAFGRRDLPAGEPLPTMGALRPVREYQAERGFRELRARGPELEPLGGSLQNGLYLFGPGQGLWLPDNGVTDHYTLQLLFRHEGSASYQKLIDFRNGTRDTGLYTYQGNLNFYTLATGGIPLPGQEHRLRVERHRGTRIVRGYLDWKPVFAFVDLDDDAVFDQGKAALFMDDRTTGGEQGPGAFRSLSVWGPAR